MPPGHLLVASYLAVPVVSRSGEVLGGLLFGHPQPGVFTERAERIVVGLAAQAAVAIDTARLYDAERSAREAAEAASRAKDEFLSLTQRPDHRGRGRRARLARRDAGSGGLQRHRSGHGETALRQLRESRVCNILLDLFMPIMNGWRFRDESSVTPSSRRSRWSLSPPTRWRHAGRPVSASSTR
jgi:GAF domain-containing protein